jgi:hypothetical protein
MIYYSSSDGYIIKFNQDLLNMIAFIVGFYLIYKNKMEASDKLQKKRIELAEL